MKIKMGNSEVNVSGLLLLAGALILDNVYANHCKKKAVAELIKASAEVNIPKRD
ncbi:MAG: hypothetical protein IKU29_05075 [Parabacteroides sp.]|nr:hypothetical protein [Parabacteroides sp.]